MTAALSSPSSRAITVDACRLSAQLKVRKRFLIFAASALYPSLFNLSMASSA